jgi:pyruvate dehydrogenase E1 component alpha subunit
MGNQFGKETYMYWYEIMLLQRRFEEKTGQLYGMQKIRGFCHLYIGQEAVSAGCMTAIRDDDNMITAYRDHGLAIAKGISPRACMAELYGKATGCTKGKGGSMHFFSKEHRFFGGHGIVGGQIGLGAGIAFAEQYKGTDSVTLCFFGDGAMGQGVLYEVMNMAALWKLPVIYVCENNHYSEYTVSSEVNAGKLKARPQAFGIPVKEVDGQDVRQVYTTTMRLVAAARRGEGPAFRGGRCRAAQLSSWSAS